jgi:cytochrome c biogenesis protein CcmG, thiol:disulfide interchange protein DsbE
MRAAWRSLGGSLLVLAAWSAAGAERPTVASLLKPLDLAAYPAGAMPPSFTARTVDSRELSLADLRGRVVVLNFWASWCLECRPEMPVLERLHREFGPRGLAVIGINAREAGVTARRYASDLGLSFPLVLDPDGKINRLYGVIGLPTTFLVGRDGRAVALAVGPRDWQSAPARAIIEAMLDEAAPVRNGRWQHVVFACRHWPAVSRW